VALESGLAPGFEDRQGHGGNKHRQRAQRRQGHRDACGADSGGGQLVRAVLGTLASPGTCISLRVQAQGSFSLEDCVASGSLTPGTAQLLARVIEAKLAFLISGGTGSGKTTFGL
jgi:Flp pilus assembly CpaF family ATPase